MAHDVNQSEMDVAAQVRSALVDRISSERYELWIPNDTQWSYSSGALRIEFTNEFACQLAKRMLAKEISQAVMEIFGFSPEVCYSVSSTTVSSTTQPTALPQATARAAGTQTAESKPRPTTLAVPPAVVVEPVKSTSITSTTTSSPSLWEHYVQGTSNQLAWTTANIIVADPGRLTPVMLHGPSGCGKSYLAAAVAERLRTVKRMRRVVHMSSEQFTNDYMEGLRGGGLPMFRRKYRDVEALILDDIQFFVGKKSTIGELRHTLDNLLKCGKQVILTADRGISELQSLGSELVGRLHSGLVAPLFPLDEGMRAEVLVELLRAASLEVGREIVDQIASRTAGDGRVLSGIAKRLTAVSTLYAQPLTWDQAWDAIQDLVHATQPVVRIVDIERAVCRMFGLEPESLQSDNKTRSISQPRMLAMFLSRKYTPAAYKEIGEYFGKRRHSTVISAEKTVEGWLTAGTNVHIGRGMTVRDAIRQVEAQLQVG
jgi:chromosomal replication initiator protein